jgi:hypothetical protein
MPAVVIGTVIEPYPHAVKAKHVDHGIVKFPVNVHGIWIERSKMSGNVTLKARQNDVTLQFILDRDDCDYLAKLLRGD